MLEKATHHEHEDVKQSEINTWFEALTDSLRTDHFIYSSGVAPKEKKEFYDDMIFGDGNSAIRNMRSESTKYFISNILSDYITVLIEKGKKPLKLSVSLSDSKILVWAEINDNDETAEDNLLLAEARVNGKYYDNGFYLNSTIVEKSDNLPVPPHYQKLID